MNAPVVILAVDPEAATPVTLGVELYGIAMRREVALSDAEGCGDALLHAHPGLDLRDRTAARRVAIDLSQHAARHPNTALVTACRSVLAMAEDVAEGATDADLHAVLAQIADLLDGALALTSD